MAAALPAVCATYACPLQAYVGHEPLVYTLPLVLLLRLSGAAVHVLTSGTLKQSFWTPYICHNLFLYIDRPPPFRCGIRAGLCVWSRLRSTRYSVSSITKSICLDLSSPVSHFLREFIVIHFVLYGSFQSVICIVPLSYVLDVSGSDSVEKSRFDLKIHISITDSCSFTVLVCNIL